MKKIKILLLAAALLGAPAAFAQQDWTAGVGYAATSFSGVDCSQFLASHPLNGFYAGVSHEFYFSALAGLTLEPGLRFYYQSGRNDTLNAPSKYIKMHYISLPVDVKYSFGLSGSLMGSVFTGPVFNVGVMGNLFEKGTFVKTKDLVDPTRQLTRVNAQWNFGAALTLAEAVQLRIGYALGLSRLIPEQDLHNNTFTVGLGLLF